MAPAPPSTSRKSSGGHLCGLYSDAQEWAQLVAGFVQQGVATGQRVAYCCDTHTPREVADALCAGGVDVEAALARGQLVLVEAAQSSLRQLTFDPDAVLAGMRRACQEAVALGYLGLWHIGEMDWCARGVPGAERILEYELRLERELFADLPLRGLCLYRRTASVGIAAALAIGAHRTHLSPCGGAVQPPCELPLAVTPVRGGVRLRGHADSETRPVLTAVLDALAGLRGHTVTLDLSGTDFMDVGALAQLTATATAFQRQGRRLVVHNPPSSLLRVAQMFPHECRDLEMTA